jgi:hypothetical protein
MAQRRLPKNCEWGGQRMRFGFGSIASAVDPASSCSVLNNRCNSDSHAAVPQLSRSHDPPPLQVVVRSIQALAHDVLSSAAENASDSVLSFAG